MANVSLETISPEKLLEVAEARAQADNGWFYVDSVVGSTALADMQLEFQELYKREQEEPRSRIVKREFPEEDTDRYRVEYEEMGIGVGNLCLFQSVTFKYYEALAAAVGGDIGGCQASIYQPNTGTRIHPDYFLGHVKPSTTIFVTGIQGEGVFEVYPDDSNTPVSSFSFSPGGVVGLLPAGADERGISCSVRHAGVNLAADRRVSAFLYVH